MTKFKTTLLAMAVSAAAFSVQAAQVSLYGSVSTGLLYSNSASLSGGVDAQGNALDNQQSVDSFSMESGFWGDSIWGITGERLDCRLYAGKRVRFGHGCLGYGR